MSKITLEKLDVQTCPLTGTTLIEASAGTGKTWAICALFLRLLLERGLGVEQILVVTFTNAAMAELRERIRDRLRQTRLALTAPLEQLGDPFLQPLLKRLLATTDVATLTQRLDAALSSFDEAAIQTIHGYCQRALGDAAFSAGQPFEQTLGSDQAIQQAVVADFWRQHIVPTTDLGLAHHLAKKLTPSILAAQLRRRLSKPLSTLIWPEALLHTPTSNNTLQTLYTSARQCWQSSGAASQALLLEAITQKLLNGQSYKAEKIEETAAFWSTWFANEELPLVPLSKEWAKACALWSAETLQAKTNKPHLNTSPQHPFFGHAQALLEALVEMQAQQDHARLSLLKRFLEEAPALVAQRKRDARQASFDDLLIKLQNALATPTGDRLAKQLQAQFPVALIDEFQDTDPLQFDIFRRIYIDCPVTQQDRIAPALFLVGDPKQAIYSFRQADLQTYLSARHRADRSYFLADNQRSIKPLIEAVNAIFSCHPNAFMQADLCFLEVGFGEKKRAKLLDQRKPTTLPALQCWSLPTEEVLTKSRAMEYAATACAREIADLLAAAQRGQVQLQSPDGQSAPLQAADIAILVRTNKQGQQIKRALAALNIAAAERATGNVFSSPEAAELENLLAALVDPGQPDRVRAALATTLAGLDAGAIAQLADTTQFNSDMGNYLLRFQHGLQTWLERGLALALHRTFAELGTRQRLLKLPEGSRRLTNCLHLIELLHQQEQSMGRIDPAGLLRWFQSQRATPAATANGADDVAQLRLESDENLVSIVTIHRSKGLEYPIVFCPFIWEGPTSHRGGKNSIDGIEYPLDNGRCIDFRDPQSDELATGKTLAKLEQAAEQLRLLYVALTRAVHRCYVIAGPYKAGKNSLKESQRSLLNWLLAGVQVDSPEHWLDQGLAWPTVETAWQTLATQALGNGPRIGFTPITTVLQRPLAQQGDLCFDTPILRTHARPAPLFPRWRTDSFTGLLRGAQTGFQTESPAEVIESQQFADRDSAIAALAADDILNFARGARAGECIHAVFEYSDFSQPDGWDRAIQDALLRHPPIKGSNPESQTRGQPFGAQQLHRMLRDVVNTPLPIHPSPSNPPSQSPQAFRLADLTPANRISELEFNLSAQGLTTTDLHTLCGQHGLALPHLAFRPLAGYLKGFIDLVFRVKHPAGHGERYFVLDWKSNYLGEQPEHYSQATMAETMHNHGYHLQALIYCLALHRHLRIRLPNYQPENHLGGALYLFVRGVRPDWASQSPDNPPGVVHWRPSLALLEGLDALLGEVSRA